MANFLTNPKAIKGNIVYGNDRTIWAVYTITPPSISQYSDESIASAQSQSFEFHTALSQMKTDEIAVLGLKGLLGAEALLTPIRDSIDDYTADEYPYIARTFAELIPLSQNDPNFQVYKRLWVVAVAYPRPADMEGFQKISRAIFAENDFDYAKNKIEAWEKEILSQFPPAAQARRADSNTFHFIHDRNISRGVIPTVFPTPTSGKKVAKGFNEFTINFSAETSVWQDDFIDEVKNNTWSKEKAKAAYATQWHDIRWGKILAVRNHSYRSESCPNGVTGYQTGLATTLYPARENYDIFSFTASVDYLNCDADVCLYYTFNDELLSIEHHQEFSKTLESESGEFGVDLFSSERYLKIAEEHKDFFSSASAETSASAMTVACVFIAGGANPLDLQRSVDYWKNNAEQKGYKLLQPFGGQLECLLAAAPGTNTKRLIDDIRAGTTISQFSSCVPMRDYYQGAQRGFPIAFNRDSKLGGWIYYDFLNATKGGGGSLLITGTQGSGKSYAEKNMLGLLSDMGAVVHVIDQSRHGEYEVFGEILPDCQIVNLGARKSSLDILKCFPPEEAKDIFAKVYLDLLGIDEKSTAADKLLYWVEPQVRETFGIRTTRNLIDKVWEKYRREPDTSDLYKMAAALRFCGQLPIAASLIDPVNSFNEIEELPVVDFAHQIIVFRTNGISAPEKGAKAGIVQRMGGAIYDTIAYLTHYRFSQIPRLSVLLGDEMHFLKNTPVLKDLVENTDLQGRKEQNIVIAASQLADHLGKEYDLVSRRIALRQDVLANAKSALNWMGMGEDDIVLQEMMFNTSPRDPYTNRVLDGREGEGWYRDGKEVTRIQMFPILGGRADYANTIAGEMERR